MYLDGGGKAALNRKNPQFDAARGEKGNGEDQGAAEDGQANMDDVMSCSRRRWRGDRLGRPVINLLLFMLGGESVICWNCRGARSREFISEMGEIM